VPGKRNKFSAIVLDTNVLVSGILNPSGNPAFLLNKIIQMEIQLALDSRIFHEYEIVLKRDKFALDATHVEIVLNYLKEISLWVSPRPSRANLVDEGDRPFMEVALTCQIPLVTGNIKHFQNIPQLQVFTPSEFINKL
jgi:putative PIN family toxin of toxin-antitoxin system